MKIVIISTFLLGTIASLTDNPGQNQVFDPANSNSKLGKRSFLGWIRKKLGIKSKNDPDEYYEDEYDDEDDYYSAARSQSRSRRYRTEDGAYRSRGSRSKVGRQRHFDEDDEDYEPRRRGRSNRNSRRNPRTRPRRPYDD